jgi:3',5'-cyclic AMP phosphodiesterase CpdA
MPRILHLSDLHFGRERPDLVAALLAQARHLAPDLVAISGDLTQRARRRELAAARRFVDALPPPVLVVPGNHDIPGVTPRRLLTPWRRWRRVFPDGFEPVLQGADFTVVGANSVRVGGPYLDWSRGRLDEAQVERLARRLEASAPADLRVLVLHHPLLLTDAGRHRGLVGGAALALRRLARAGLDLALGGHVHLPYAGRVNGVVVAHAGTSVSDRLVGAANGFNLLDADRARIVVEHWRAADDGRFVPDGRSSFPRRMRREAGND